jgi:hypothetical protein
MKCIPLFLSTLVFSVLLFSCHPDHSEQKPPTDTGPTDTSQISKNLLGSSVETSPTGVTTQTYRYDAQNRLVWYGNTSTEPGYFKDTSKIIWDNNNHISQIIYSSDTSRRYPDPSVDSIVYNVVYDAAASKYIYKLTQYKMYNVKWKDSTAYTYNAQGKISQENAYYFDYKTTKTYIKWATHDYTYNSSGDLVDWKTTFFDIDSNHTDYPRDLTYSYEDKGVNLLNLGNEAIVVGIPLQCAAHIPKTMVGTYALEPKWNQNLSYTYTYNTKYRPLKAATSDAVSGTKTNLVFTYQ